jgi:hypothetical protein
MKKRKKRRGIIFVFLFKQIINYNLKNKIYSYDYIELKKRVNGYLHNNNKKKEKKINNQIQYDS